jgi:molecular chaperone GrpE (heat shock protein)
MQDEKFPCLGKLESGCSMKVTEDLVNSLIAENKILKRILNHQEPSSNSTDLKILANNQRLIELQLATLNRQGGPFSIPASSQDSINCDRLEKKVAKLKDKNKRLKAELAAKGKSSEELVAAKQLLATRMKEVEDLKAQSVAKDVMIAQLSQAPPAVVAPPTVPVSTDILEKIAEEAFGPSPSSAASSPSSPQTAELQNKIADLERQLSQCKGQKDPQGCISMAEFDEYKQRTAAQLDEAEKNVAAAGEINATLKKDFEELKVRFAECTAQISEASNLGQQILVSETIPATPSPSATTVITSETIKELKDAGITEVSETTTRQELIDKWPQWRLARMADADEWYNIFASYLAGKTGIPDIIQPDAPPLSAMINAHLSDYQADMDKLQPEDLLSRAKYFWLAAGEAMADVYAGAATKIKSNPSPEIQAKATQALNESLCFSAYELWDGNRAKLKTRFSNSFKKWSAGVSNPQVALPNRFIQLNSTICNNQTTLAI